MAAGYVYFMSRKGGKDPNALRSVTASKTIRTNVASVYEYISTPDFRTEWHMGAVEVAGPAIDHSAVTGERSWGHEAISRQRDRHRKRIGRVGVGEVRGMIISRSDGGWQTAERKRHGGRERFRAVQMNFGGHTWHVDWTVLERQFPTSASTHFAEFVLEGKAKRGNGQEQRWVESVRIKGDKNQEARAVLVEMEVAVSGEGVRADEQGKLLRRSISRGLKESLKMLRQRIEN
eukprot:759640-Hanusia_phi.AAC.2